MNGLDEYMCKGAPAAAKEGARALLMVMHYCSSDEWISYYKEKININMCSKELCDVLIRHNGRWAGLTDGR